jgi:N-formylglutamate deformylase
MGAVYMATTDGAKLRASLTTSERSSLLARFYEPHHAALELAFQRLLDTHEECLIIDAHSFPSTPLPCDLNQATASGRRLLP